MFAMVGAVTTRFEIGKLRGATGRNITQDHQEIAYAANPDVTVHAQHTYLSIAQLTGAMTLDLTLDAGLQPGDLIHASVSADATGRTLTFGANIIGANLVLGISASGGFVAQFNGTAFVVVGTHASA